MKITFIRPTAMSSSLFWIVAIVSGLLEISSVEILPPDHCLLYRFQDRVHRW
ncbi:hypothetical protein [Methanoculleus sp. 10]|uniref:hypothetical protein n=1 Tax=Methanoculleus sp. 10 TaxID=430615 RepID=UPI0025F8E9D6|nr:hypothetical protein [Methanoculleus sp. 10]